MSRRTSRPIGLTLSGIVAVLCAAALHASTAAPVADAAMDGSTEAVRALLKQGADVNAAQGDGLTALHWAAKKGDADLASMLVYAGANVRATTRLAGYTPLHMAAEIGSAPVINALVKAGADVAVTTMSGTTPLMLAAASGDAASVTALLDAGARPNVKEFDRGHTALMFAPRRSSISPGSAGMAPIPTAATSRRTPTGGQEATPATIASRVRRPPRPRRLRRPRQPRQQRRAESRASTVSFS
jgi:hypothetical protein